MRFNRQMLLAGAVLTALGMGQAHADGIIDKIKDEADKIAGNLKDQVGKLLKGHAIEVSAKNQSSQTLYIFIDDTGRHDEKVKMDAAKTSDGKNLPPGLIVKPGQDKTFGDSIGAGDVPTIHVYTLNSSGVASEKAAKKFGPDDYGPKLLEKKRPTINLEITDSDIAAK